MGGDLGERLGRLREARKKAPAQESCLPRGGGAAEPLGIPGFERVGTYTYRRVSSFSSNLPPSFSRSFLLGGRSLNPASLLFFDLETSGLSGGAGNLVFLAGFGRVRDGRGEVVQLFLSDYPGEREFLSFLREELSSVAVFGTGNPVEEEAILEGILVSYNGKSFDIPVLRNRFLMTGSNLVVPRHLDLLHPVRTLFRGRYPELSLGSVERFLLKTSRENDLPGALVPERYFAFLRSGDFRFLSEVFSHHLQDIVSLAGLCSYLEAAFRDPASHPEVPRFPLGRIIFRQDRELGLALVREAMDEGDLRAGLFLGYSHKVSGQWDAALRVWKQLYEERRSFAALVEMLKYLEHHARDYEQALSLIAGCLSRLLPFEAEKRTELARRNARIEHKRARSAGNL